MPVYSFQPAIGQTALVFAGAGGFFFALLGASWAIRGNALLAGVLIVLAVLAGLVAAIMGYRLVMRPTMIAVSEEGIFMKRLGVTLPWEAIGAILRRTHEGGDLIELRPAEGRHLVFEERTVLLGMALNERAGLPPLAIAMSQYSGTVEDFEAAVLAFGRASLLQDGT